MTSNRLYPSWEELQKMHAPLPPGVQCLVKFLDDSLPRDNFWKVPDKLSEYKGWLIFAQPYLNGTRPDVVIFHPYVGVVIYEVKDWLLSSYKYDSNGKRFYAVNADYGEIEKLAPMKQVECYKEILIEQLISNIGEAVDSNFKLFGLIRTGLYFHNAKTEDCRSMFYPKNNSDGKRPPYLHSPCFGYDAINLMSKYDVNEIVPDFHRSQSGNWNRKWNEEILFWLKPPHHSLEQCRKLTLRGNQKRIAEPEPGHYRVRGVAGSGKTQALAYRAAKLAANNKNVLILTYNITLWHYIKDMIARAPFEFEWDRLKFGHFHGFCKDIICREAGNNWPQNENQGKDERDLFFRKVVPDAVTKALSEMTGWMRYDGILIDEGQDYEYEWYDLLNQYFLTTRDEMVIVCDKRQNIYNRDLNWLDKRVVRKGLEKFGDFIDLNVSVRQPPRLAHFSKAFADEFGLKNDIVQLPNPGNDFAFEKIVWYEVSNSCDKINMMKLVYQAFLRMKREKQSPSDIVVLTFSHKIGLELVKYFETEKHIMVNHIFEKDPDVKTHKKTFWRGDGRLKMCTIHSFKGWELQNVILMIPEESELGLTDTEQIKELDRLVYTALTRVKQNIIVLNQNSRYTSFGKHFPATWAQND